MDAKNTRHFEQVRSSMTELKKALEDLVIWAYQMEKIQHALDNPKTTKRTKDWLTTQHSHVSKKFIKNQLASAKRAPFLVRLEKYYFEGDMNETEKKHLFAEFDPQELFKLIPDEVSK